MIHVRTLWSLSRSSSVLLVATAVLFIAACGREPTDPSKSDLTGVWRSFDRDLYISNIEMTLAQPSPGIVIGKWRAQGRTDNACTPGLVCADSSIVTGRNEVSQVVLDLLGAGTFVGELAKADTLKGIIRSQGTNYHVTFGR
ncbi:MAG: hypothetical protein Q7S20_04360 [Gemmatimonadaceae bacterium]|nr:hypothetical protein [Gemmatimonadaceae bacterium]